MKKNTSTTQSLDKLHTQLFYKIDGKFVTRDKTIKSRHIDDKILPIYAADKITGFMENIEDMKDYKSRFIGTKHFDLQTNKRIIKDKSVTIENRLKRQLENFQNYTDGVCKIFAGNDPTKFAIVDPEDLERCGVKKWFIFQSSNNEYYLTTYAGSYKTILLHRFILGLGDKSDGLVVDHIDGNSLNCRKSNLQLLTHGDNIRKTTKTYGNCKYKGVSRTKTGRYNVCFRDANGIGRKMKGSWDNAIDAAQAYDQMIVMIYPIEKCVLNKNLFPQDFPEGK